ncbi:MAG: tRNA pseudouridine(55) synthase TruB [Acidobacteria bacterium]|nr:tRNA pseudouridine(55) synthase TruB [Acidobacteriota bacterium]
MNGAIVLDKPEGITSHSAVVQARRILGERRIGHIGTLDPFATGVLVLLLGQATRLARFYKDRVKSYQGTIRFGFATDTYDRTGTPTSPVQQPVLDSNTLQRVFSEFTGAQLQQPPPISAKKVAGVPAYRLTRKGHAPQLSAVQVNIHELELLSVSGDCAAFRARVSSGTYVRSLAHDIGQRLGCGAHLQSLRRTAVGEFTLTQAVTLEELRSMKVSGTIPVIAMELLLAEFPSVDLGHQAATSAMHGNSVPVDCSDSTVKLLNPSGELIAIAERDSPNTCHPVVVFQSSSVTPANTKQLA